jgi:hypothetical protein
MDAHDIVPAVAGMISYHQHRRNKMALQTNDDFANCELSIEELDAIAAGWPGWARSIGRGLESAAHVAGSVLDVAFKGLVVATVVYAGVIVGGAIFGGQKPTNLN